MNITLLSSTFEINNKSANAEEVMGQILQSLQSNNQYLSHLIIDEVEVYDDFKGYISERIGTLSTIKVLSMSLDQFCQETVLSILQYLNRAFPQLDDLTDRLYQAEESSTWKDLVDFIDGLGWLLQASHSLLIANYFQESNDVVNGLINKTTDVVTELSNAMEQRDFTLMADLIKYEIISSLKELEQVGLTLLDGEDGQHDLN